MCWPSAASKPTMTAASMLLTMPARRSKSRASPASATRVRRTPKMRHGGECFAPCRSRCSPHAVVRYSAGSMVCLAASSATKVGPSHSPIITAASTGTRPHHVELIEGEPIDLHDDLDVIWRDKPGGPKAAATNDQHINADTREDAELIRCVVTGEHLHVELCALAARYIGRCIPGPTVEEMLRGMMLSHPEGARDERWYDRYELIPELVRSARRKYRDDDAARQRPLYRLARQLVREDRPPDKVRARVAAEAEALGFDADAAARSIAWAAKLEIERVGVANA